MNLRTVALVLSLAVLLFAPLSFLLGSHLGHGVLIGIVAGCWYGIRRAAR